MVTINFIRGIPLVSRNDVVARAIPTRPGIKLRKNKLLLKGFPNGGGLLFYIHIIMTFDSYFYRKPSGRSVKSSQRLEHSGHELYLYNFGKSELNAP